MSLVNIKIEGHPYQVEEGLTTIDAARACGYEIPSLCDFNHGECNQGSCRVCLVEVKGMRSLVASCVFPVFEGMEISISSPKATAARRTSVELLLSNHSVNCQQCDKNGKCELLHVAKLTGARPEMFKGSQTPVTIDELNPSIVRDTSKCILCGRCVARCRNAHGNGVLGFEKRGFNTIVAPAENRSFANSPCILCGQCVSVCPVGALQERTTMIKETPLPTEETDTITLDLFHNYKEDSAVGEATFRVFYEYEMGFPTKTEELTEITVLADEYGNPIFVALASTGIHFMSMVWNTYNPQSVSMSDEALSSLAKIVCENIEDDSLMFRFNLYGEDVLSNEDGGKDPVILLRHGKGFGRPLIAVLRLGLQTDTVQGGKGRFGGGKVG